MREGKRGLGCAVGLFLLLVILAAGIAAGLKLYERYGPTYEMADKRDVFQISGEQVAILLDGQLQDSKGIWEDNQVYLPVSWVNKGVNQRFYWDSEEELLIYTLPEEIVYADAKTQGESGFLLKVKEGEAYLSLGLIANYSDIRIQAFATSEIKRVFIDTSWEPQQQAQVKRTGMVRMRGGVKSPVICEAEKDDTVTVLETMDHWSKVRTADGYVGYIENRRLKETEPLTPVSSFKAPVYQNISMDEPVVLAFHQVFVQEANQNLEQLLSETKGINVIVPTWFVIQDTEGNYSSIASRDYVEKAHAMGIQVWAMLNNVSTTESAAVDIKKLMSSTSAREKLIESLMEDAGEYGFDGINLDFESLRADAGPHYVQFIRELSVSCRKAGLVLSIDNYVPSAYTEFYNRREQGIVADYVIIMGYDEHYAGGEPGPVASISFVENGIQDTLEQVPGEKVINAVPFYTRLWTTDEDNSSTSQVFDMEEEALWLQENDLTPQWQEDLGLYYVQRQGENGLEQLWMEEERSLQEKMNRIRKYGLAGVACWKLGFETPDIWDIIGQTD